MDLVTMFVLPTLFNGLLVLLDLCIVLRYTLWAKRVFPRWVDLLPAVALVMLVGSVLVGIQSPAFAPQLVAPLALGTLALFFATLPRLIRRNRPVPAARWRWPKAVSAIVCGALVLLSTQRLIEINFYTAAIFPAMQGLLYGPGDSDFSERSWSEGFAGLVGKLEQEYPYTDWKSINWQELSAEFSPRIADAERRGDANAYYHTLREFAWRIPDAHIGLEGGESSVAVAEVGGSYGVKFLPLDDGRLVISAILDAHQAAESNIRIGAEVVSWHGEDAAQALAHTSTIWSEYPAATKEGLLLQQARFLSRGPVGSTVEMMFRNPGETTLRSAKLTAVAADIGELPEIGLGDFLSTPVESRVLPSGYGYIRIKYELPAPLGFPDAEVQQAVASFTAANVPGIIVDVRTNLGGESGLSARMLAPFFGQEQIYQRLEMFDPATNTFRAVKGEPMLIAPTHEPYAGKVAVLIDQYSHSAAEDIALNLKKLPNTTVVGMSGTSGAGGVSETGVKLPGGYTFAFPKARALDGDLAIKIESDRTGNGGVAPDVRVPRDEATVQALATGEDVALRYAEESLRTALETEATKR